MDLYSPASIVAVGVALPLTAAVAVFLRFLVRLKIQPTFLGVDDWMVLVALVFALGDGANLCVGAVLGILGRNWEGQVPTDRQMIQDKSDYAQLILEKPLYALMKLSVLFFYRRIFSSEQRFMRFNTYMIWLISTWSTIYFLAEIFQCGVQPWQLWSPNSTQPACVNRSALNLSYAVTDVISDILVVSMPFPVIRHLMMDGRQKIGVAVIFLLGAISTAAAIARLGFIVVAFTQNYGAIGINTHEATTPPSVWSTVEGSVGLLAACLPPLGPLLRRVPRARKASLEAFRRYKTRKGYGMAGDGGSFALTGAPPNGMSSMAYDDWGAPIRKGPLPPPQSTLSSNSSGKHSFRQHVRSKESRQLSQASELTRSRNEDFESSSV